MGSTGARWGGGGNLGKMAKNCTKITKSAFLGQNSGVTWVGQANFSGSGEWGAWEDGDPPPVPPPLGENLIT